jgi:hypothetical protein
MSTRSNENVLHIALNQNKPKRGKKQTNTQTTFKIQVESALVHDGVQSFVSFDDWLDMMQNQSISLSEKLSSILSIESESWGTRIILPVSWIQEQTADSIRSILNACIGILEETINMHDLVYISLSKTLMFMILPIDTVAEFRWSHSSSPSSLGMTWQFNYETQMDSFEAILTFLMECCALFIDNESLIVRQSMET